MARYRLPADLLAAMVELPEDGGAVDEDGVWMLRFDLPGGRIRIQLEALEEVPPLLPPEPGMQTVVIDKWGYAWQNVMNGRGPWCRTVKDDAAEWEELNQRFGPLTPLVPDPLAGAPELPWEHQCSDERGPFKVSVSSAVTRAVYVEGWSHLTAAEARQMGLALLRAAAEQEANS